MQNSLFREFWHLRRFWAYIQFGFTIIMDYSPDELDALLVKGPVLSIGVSKEGLNLFYFEKVSEDQKPINKISMTGLSLSDAKQEILKIFKTSPVGYVSYGQKVPEEMITYTAILFRNLERRKGSGSAIV